MFRRFRVVGLALVFFGFTQSVAAKTLVYCAEGSPKIFNPQLAVDGPTFNASARTIYDRLVEFEPGKTKIVSSLAESWKISGNGLKYTFHLRKDVQFHSNTHFKPTRPFNADDILFTFNRMRKQDHPYHRVNGGTYEYFNSMDLAHVIKDIKKVNDHTVVFELKNPEAPFLADMAMDFASLLSAEYGDILLKKKMPERIDLDPIGTGPFEFKGYVKDTLIRYEAFPQYFRGKAVIEKLVFSITPDPSVRFQKLKTGECHLDSQPSFTDIDRMKTLNTLQVYEDAGLNVGYIAMNVEKKPFDNPMVRQAINHAVNRKAYIEAVYLGKARVADTPLPPTQWAHDSSIKGYDYDPKKAKELLTKAGFPQGFETELWTLPVSRPYIPNGKKLGEMIQADLALVGIKVRLLTYKWATYLEKASKGEHSLAMLGWVGDNGDPDNFLGVLLSCASVKGGSNYSRWCNKDFDQLITSARRVTSVEERERLYAKAQRKFVAEAPWIPLAHSNVYKASRSNVVGFKLSPFGIDSMYGVSLR